jgi:transposase-like protein
MNKHKTEDYKISAVKYYLNNDKGDGYKKTCKIFDCKKSTLRDWIKRYNTSKILHEETETLFLIRLLNHK